MPELYSSHAVKTVLRFCSYAVMGQVNPFAIVLQSKMQSFGCEVLRLNPFLQLCGS